MCTPLGFCGYAYLNSGPPAQQADNTTVNLHGSSLKKKKKNCRKIDLRLAYIQALLARYQTTRDVGEKSMMNTKGIPKLKVFKTKNKKVFGLSVTEWRGFRTRQGDLRCFSSSKVKKSHIFRWTSKQ